MIHGFISSRLGYRTIIYLGISQTLRSHLLLVQNAAARLLYPGVLRSRLKHRENWAFAHLDMFKPLNKSTSLYFYSLAFNPQSLHTSHEQNFGPCLLLLNMHIHKLTWLFVTGMYRCAITEDGQSTCATWMGCRWRLTYQDSQGHQQKAKLEKSKSEWGSVVNICKTIA